MKTRISLVTVSLLGFLLILKISLEPVILRACLEKESAARVCAKGLRCLEEGDLDAALAAFDRALAIDPGFAQGYCERGNAHAIRGEYDKAIDDFTHAICLKPQYETAFRNRGDAYLHQGDARQACAEFIKATWISIATTRWNDGFDAVRSSGLSRNS
jgi:tetratricopeptide (TPR) repeat protein